MILLLHLDHDYVVGGSQLLGWPLLPVLAPRLLHLVVLLTTQGCLKRNWAGFFIKGVLPTEHKLSLFQGWQGSGTQIGNHFWWQDLNCFAQVCLLLELWSLVRMPQRHNDFLVDHVLLKRSQTLPSRRIISISSLLWCFEIVLVSFLIDFLRFQHLVNIGKWGPACVRPKLFFLSCRLQLLPLLVSRELKRDWGLNF
jgi:hypothetical protein